MTQIVKSKYLLDCQYFVYRSRINNIMEKERDNLNRVNRVIETLSGLCEIDIRFNNELNMLRNDYAIIIDKMERISEYLQNKINEVRNV